MTLSMRLLGSIFLVVTAASAERVEIATSPLASEAEQTAAAELAGHLARLYPSDTFAVRAGAPDTGKVILVGTPASFPEILRWVPKASLAVPESFVVANAMRSDAPVAVIAGADARGVLYGVYALLEKLGWGFYLSYEAAPAARKQPFEFAEWNLADAPVFADRVVFDWHNFLSSASAWEFEDWQNWIRGAARMRYNTVMVHAYGNNPMFEFRHDGQQKPVGYLTTTRSGRDWGTEHVYDVRRIWGGEAFHGPVFGSSVALVPEAERAPAAEALVRKAFTFARSYGLHVTFALDVDTESANPPNVILALPESARFRSGKYQLPNPDTPEGYKYFKAQAARLFELYPQIDRLVVWFRDGRTPWCNVKPEEFPAAWKVRYEAALEKNPRMRQDNKAASMFAIGRIAAAFDKALGELGRADVELGAGTWGFDHLQAADVFFEPSVKLYWLDTDIVFGQPATQAALRSVRRGRSMLPIVWAHHDDRTYVGRPYTPFPNFASLVEGTGTGFGIIHWTTRPLDIYFKSLAEQVWQRTRNRPLPDTARDMAARSFGDAASRIGGEYLVKWVTEGRMFGRETFDRFIDVPLKDAAEVIARCRERIALLARIDGSALPQEGRERLQYYRDYDEFVAQFFRSHAAFERAQQWYQAGEIEKARSAIRESDPHGVIEQYLAAASRGGMTRGEQALLISLNLRWRPYLISLRQALGLEPARFKFLPTQHEPLAQGAGKNTFWIDAGGALWTGMGERETQAPAVVLADNDEMCSTGIRIDKPVTLTLAAAMGDALADGRYRVKVFAPPGQQPDVQLRGAPDAPPVDGAKPVEVRGGNIAITFRPPARGAAVCGLELTMDGSR